MKTLFYLSILFLPLFSCSKSDKDDTNPTTSNLIGKWKQIEIFGSNGGSNPTWQKVTNGYTIEFLSNGKFISSKFTECSTGGYAISITNEISMTYNCSSFTNNYIEKVETNTNSQLIIKPTYLECDEGCSVKFEKEN